MTHLYSFSLFVLCILCCSSDSIFIDMFFNLRGILFIYVANCGLSIDHVKVKTHTYQGRRHRLPRMFFEIFCMFLFNFRCSGIWQTRYTYDEAMMEGKRSSVFVYACSNFWIAPVSFLYTSMQFQFVYPGFLHKWLPIENLGVWCKPFSVVWGNLGQMWFP